MVLSRRSYTRRSPCWLTLCAALGLSACSIAPHPELSRRSVKTSEACAQWRWIGISRAGARCPEVAGWTVQPLFPQLAPALSDQDCRGERNETRKVPSPEVIRELNRFCVYEIAQRKKKLHHVPFPPTVTNDLARFDRDCAALALIDTTPGPEAWKKEGENTFLAQAAGLRKPLDITGQLGVRLAFLDTQATGEGVPEHPGRSLHGYELAHLAEGLVCTPGPPDRCAAQIATRLALPIFDFDPKDPKKYLVDTDRGGFMGMQSDLAEAIRSEVDEWLPKRARQRHLVLNLSLAWDGTLFGGLSAEQVADMSAGTQAVYRALEYARGFDVLVLAAAGNRKKDPCANYGPLLPAAWEMGAPGKKGCGQADEEPLVYAVGGLQANGAPLANARPGGMPRRAAYGQFKPFVGSSVATAVASSIAAVVWDTFPDLTASEVMQILDGKGSEPNGLLAMNADFWFGMNQMTAIQAEPQVRRLTLCSVLEQACNERPGIPCPLDLTTGCSSLRPEVVEISQGDASVEVPQGSCQPWLLPQPEDDPCLGCPPPDGSSP